MKAQSKDFSKRERDVVGLLLEGKSNKQIAFILEIAETTVEFHLRNVVSSNAFFDSANNRFDQNKVLSALGGL